METLEALLNRLSISNLQEPAPSKEQLEMAYQAALRAPDHGRLTPWLFITVSGKERSVLGGLLAEAAKDQNPEISDKNLEKWKDKPLKAPMVIIAVAKIKDHPKIPDMDMVLSAAAAIQNLKLAFFDMGFSSYWRTGIVTESDILKRSMKLNMRDQILGFIYVGTPGESTKTAPKRDSADYFVSLSDWVNQ